MLRLAALLLATPAAADPAHGLWRTAVDGDGNHGIVEIAPCGSDLCGTIVTGIGPDGAVIPEAGGALILVEMKPRGNGRYGGGRVYSPEHGREFASRMTLRGDVLTVEGCFIGICQGQDWTRLRETPRHVLPPARAPAIAPPHPREETP